MINKNKQRAELCIHTTMSDSVSVIAPKALLEAAALCGMRAIAVTDKNSVQSFPEVAKHRDLYYKDLKVIYGAELPLNPGEFATVLTKDQSGLKPLYKLISGKTITAQEREHLLIGVHDLCLLSKLAHAKDAAEFCRLSEGYDYIELIPYHYDSSFIQQNKKLYALGKEQDKLVVAVGDCHYLFPHHRLGKDVLGYAHDGIVSADEQHLRTTEEMLELYAYLGDDAAYEVVVTNPCKLADGIEQVDPQKGNFRSFEIQNAEQEVKRICAERLHTLYGEQPLVLQRLEDELAQVRDTAFSMYFLCHKIVRHLHEQGGVTGHRGTVGSTLIAYLLGISDTNPLPAHHRCPHCKYIEFSDVVSGYDLPKRACPICGTTMLGDGHNIPFETCLGVAKDMDMDIDINTAPPMQTEAKRFLADWFGAERLAVAGTIGTYLRPAIKSYTHKYAEWIGEELSKDEQEWVFDMVSEVKRCEGIHPGGIMLLPEGVEWEDVTPLRPNDNDDSILATHMDCHSIDPSVPKLDILSVKYYGLLQKLCKTTGVGIENIDYQDPTVYELFSKAETCGIPEFSGKFTQELLRKVNATSFSDLVKVSGMAHGTEVWRNNGEVLLPEHSFGELIGDRDDVFLTLRKYGVDRKDAYALMTATRKGKLPWVGKHPRLRAESERKMEVLQNSDVPQWYVDSMCKIYYLFPKAHAAHYTKLAVAFAWFKVHYPNIFYKVTLSNAKIAPFVGCSDTELQMLLKDLDRQEWEAASLLLEARQCGYADAEMYPA